LNPLIGTKELIWDGKNSNGENISSGVYYLSARIKGKVYSKKILKFD
jgi:flagellar hook assembly protein FlgD